MQYVTSQTIKVIKSQENGLKPEHYSMQYITQSRHLVGFCQKQILLSFLFERTMPNQTIKVINVQEKSLKSEHYSLQYFTLVYIITLVFTYPPPPPPTHTQLQ